MTSANSNSKGNDNIFKNDIFISYSRASNQSPNPSPNGLSGQNDGWVTQFYHCLKANLGGYSDGESDIFIDEQMEGTDKFPERLRQEVEQSALFLAILSPSYLKRPWCQAEAKHFFNITKNHAENNDYKSRTVKVLHIWMENHHQKPEEFQEVIGYNFCYYDSIKQKYTPIRPENGNPAKSEFNKRITDLVEGIVPNLKILRNHKYENLAGYDEVSKDAEKLIYSESFQDLPTQEGRENRKKNISVYLAETNQFLNNRLSDIKRDLEKQGYTVIPKHSQRYYKPESTSETDSEDQTLTYVPDVKKRINEDLRCCILSIHLIDETYGDRPKGFNKSIIEMQYEAAMNYHQENNNFSPIVWVSNKLQVQPNYRDDQFFDEIKNAPDFLQTSFEELRSIIKDRLKDTDVREKQSNFDAQINKIATQIKKIYFIYESDDEEAIQLLDDYLYNEKGYEVMRPLDSNPEEAEREHQECLKYCDAVLIYWGNSSELWVRKKLDDLQNSINLRSANPISAKILYIATPQRNQKEKFRTRQVGTDEIKKNFGDFAPADLESFLSQLA
jgi:hypothetical protein